VDCLTITNIRNDKARPDAHWRLAAMPATDSSWLMNVAVSIIEDAVKKQA